MAKKLPLTQGKHALVDDEDYGRLISSGFRWTAMRIRGVWYAKAHKGSLTLLMHRFVLGLKLSLPKIDHKNGDGLDNRRANLRTATVQQNSWNMASRRGKSRFKGVDWSKQKGKWRARIHVEGKDRHLGFFEDEIDAGKAYDAAAKKYFGKYARMNNGTVK